MARAISTRTVGGERLIAGLLERGVLNSGEKLDYAFGVVQGTYRGLSTVGTAGRTPATGPRSSDFPRIDSAWRRCVTSRPPIPTQLSHRVADVFLADKLTPTSAVAVVAEAPEVPLDAEQLSQFAGLY